MMNYANANENENEDANASDWLKENHRFKLKHFTYQCPKNIWDVFDYKSFEEKSLSKRQENDRIQMEKLRNRQKNYENFIFARK